MSGNFKILIRCPATGQVLDMGMQTSGREVLNSDIYRGGKRYCRFCGQLHPLEDAFVDVVGGGWEDALWHPNA